MNQHAHTPFDIAEFRRRPRSAGAARAWRSLEEILDDGQLEAWVRAEFPAAAPRMESADGRRTFLKLMGASLLMGSLAGCGETPSDLARPHVNQPENMLPGVAKLYATAIELSGYAQPVLATCHDGRPTKLDGNPLHPATPGGGSDVFMQAAVLQLYDPDRSKAPVRDGLPSTWPAFERELAALRAGWTARGGEGVRILTAAISSPTLNRQLKALLASLPNARLHIFEPTADTRRQAALRTAFGRDADIHYALKDCAVVVSLGDDLLGPGPRQVGHARGWAKHRGEVAPGPGRLRLHVAEATPTLTGIAASTRLSADPSRLALLVQAIGAHVGATQQSTPALAGAEAEWAATAARELMQNPGRGVLACGPDLPAPLQALALWINHHLQNAGKTLRFTEPVTSRSGDGTDLAALAEDMRAGKVDTLIVLDSNPAFSAPGALGFETLMKDVRVRLHAGLYRDETAMACDWHLPLSHPLESWGDLRTVDGTATILQPVIGTLYQTRTLPQIVAGLMGEIDPAADAAVRATWQSTFGSDFEARWRTSLHDGFVAGTAASVLSLAAKQPDLPSVSAATGGNGRMEVAFRPDPCSWDGRFANVAWLQELPKPISKITWDSPIAISPRTASDLRVANGDLIEVAVGERRVAGPAWIAPGQAQNTVVLTMRYGRRHGGRLAEGLGYSAYAVMPKEGTGHAFASVRPQGGARKLATTQLHHSMEGFDFVRHVTASEPSLPAPKPATTLYPEWPDAGYAWGMVIDLDRCTGCNACIAACNVENNVQVVGKDQVAIGREMLWLRVDHYYTGDIEAPQSSFQPVPCMHCEKAPCEMGCPVHATVHSREGVNQMVYNRCIGTRTCSSYCPYKVRRFNWLDYRHFDEPTQASHNPDVTVRARGVMEKCTYCTQRIQAAHVTADKEGRALREGDVVTACQQACPTSAIVFGNIKDPAAAVSRLRQSGRSYALLEELGTRPRTTYLARWTEEPEAKHGGNS
jgi:MoCo/4Fe-4S cofactor protein with predicted Tat translocation signal